MKLFFVSLVALLCSCVSTTVVQPSGAVMSPEGLSDRTVALVHSEGFTDTHMVDAFCTGTWVRDNIIVTALHCVREDVLEVFTYVVKTDVYESGDPHERATKGHKAVVAMVDDTHDLAVLKTVGPVPDHANASVTAETVYQGEPVMTMGGPLGLVFSFSKGDVAAVRYWEAIGGGETLFIQTTAPISPGNSGGGLFNNYGQLIGVCHAHFPQGQNLNLFIHYQYVDKLLKDM